ncbi:hypothetical protein BC827DRAFT_618849 [Russula dissimulans]|jgi:hypothetical protein|nr:hypothetical protein BC827DRAFT_618849 [Russula dissimulans]
MGSRPRVDDNTHGILLCCFNYTLSIQFATLSAEHLLMCASWKHWETRLTCLPRLLGYMSDADGTLVTDGDKLACKNCSSLGPHSGTLAPGWELGMSEKVTQFADRHRATKLATSTSPVVDDRKRHSARVKKTAFILPTHNGAQQKNWWGSTSSGIERGASLLALPLEPEAPSFRSTAALT